MSSSVMLFTEMQSTEVDNICSMKYWYMEHFGGNGILPASTVLTDKILEETLKDFRLIANMEDIGKEPIQELVDSLVVSLTDEDKKNVRAMELLYRRIGWMVAFALFTEPSTRNIYETLDTGDDIILDKDPLWVGIKACRVLRDRTTSEILYREYIPTGFLSNKALNAWKYSPRIHVSIAAAAQDVKKDVKHGQVMGLAKGFISSDSKLMHPYVYGYYDKTTGFWATSKEQSKMNGASFNWVERPIWEYPGGMITWVTNCGPDTARYQFPLSDRILFNEQLLNEWAERRTNRERTIRTMKATCATNAHLRSIHFPKNGSQCQPAFGEDCPYIDACWNLEKPGQILKSGKYIPVAAMVNDAVIASVTSGVLQ